MRNFNNVVEWGSLHTLYQIACTYGLHISLLSVFEVNNYLTLHEQVIAPQSIQNLSHIILCRGSLNHFDSVDEMVVLSSEISVDSNIPVKLIVPIHSLATANTI